MGKLQFVKQYDLEERSLNFAHNVRVFVNLLTKSISNIEDMKQLIRASGSVGANYIEANESLSKKDFVLRVKISKKEAKECRYWLRLIYCQNKELEQERELLFDEVTELMKIFGAILEKSR